MSNTPESAEAVAELARCRDAIEVIDRQIIELLSQRMTLGRRTGDLKRIAGLPILDPTREAAVIRRVAGEARDIGLPAEPIREIFWQIVGMSRRAQEWEEPVSRSADGYRGSARDTRRRRPEQRCGASHGMSGFDTVAIVGLGLIGGSVARDLAALGVRVCAYDPDTTHLASAIRTHVVESALDASLDGLRDVDIVIIAVPVDAAIDVLRRVATRATRARLITDVGSTKSRIVELAGELGVGERFVGAHPLTGDHRSGWAASRSGLFRDARVFLCPPREATAAAIELAQDLWRRLGALPEQMDAQEHDVLLAWTSHLPHLLSASLALALARVGVARGDLGPGGRDVTRLAGSSPDMWSAIAMENAPAMEEALRETERELASFRAALSRGNASDVRARFVAAREWFGQ